MTLSLAVKIKRRTRVDQAQNAPRDPLEEAQRENAVASFSSELRVLLNRKCSCVDSRSSWCSLLRIFGDNRPPPRILILNIVFDALVLAAPILLLLSAHLPPHLAFDLIFSTFLVLLPFCKLDWIPVCLRMLPIDVSF